MATIFCPGGNDLTCLCATRLQWVKLEHHKILFVHNILVSCPISLKFWSISNLFLNNWWNTCQAARLWDTNFGRVLYIATSPIPFVLHTFDITWFNITRYHIHVEWHNNLGHSQKIPHVTLELWTMDVESGILEKKYGDKSRVHYIQSGPSLNIKIPSCRYSKSHRGDRFISTMGFNRPYR